MSNIMNIIHWKVRRMIPMDGFVSIIYTAGKSEVATPCPTLRTPWTMILPGLLAMEFSRQEYWQLAPFS